MEKVLIAGAAGALGFEVLKILHQQGIPVRAHIHQEKDEEGVRVYTNDVFIADASQIHHLEGICDGIDIVFAALGKRLSLFSPQTDPYPEIQYTRNRNLLHTALDEGVKRFVYTSMETKQAAVPLKVALAHRRIQTLLEKSPLRYTIIQPVDYFPSLQDLLILTKRGFIPILGSGIYKTNCIHPADLAQVVVDHLKKGPPILKVGGPEVNSRKEIAQMISKKTRSRILPIPIAVARAGLTPLSFFRKAQAAWLEYFNYANTHDVLAPCYGKIGFQEYLNELELNLSS